MKYNEADFSRWDDRPDADVWADWVLTRKEKRARSNQTAINRAGKWVNLLFQMGYSANLTLSIACDKGYQGLEWVYENEKKRGFPEVQQIQRDNVMPIQRDTRSIGLTEELEDTSWAN